MRPAKPLIVKLASAVGLTVGELEDWLTDTGGASTGNCWRGSTKVFHEGKPQSTLRLLVELDTGEPLGADKRMRVKLCPTVGCLNPRHYRSRPYQTWQQRVGIGHAAKFDLTHLIAEAFDPAVAEAGDFNDVCDLISSEDGGRHRSASDLQAQWPIYDLELFDRALAHLGAAGE